MTKPIPNHKKKHIKKSDLMTEINLFDDIIIFLFIAPRFLMIHFIYLKS